MAADAEHHFEDIADVCTRFLDALLRKTCPKDVHTRLSHQWGCGLVGLRIGNVSLDAIAVYASVSLGAISIFAAGEHSGGASHKYMATAPAIDSSVESISSEPLQFFVTTVLKSYTILAIPLHPIHT